MSNKWAVNASPLILLAKVGHLTLLPKLTARRLEATVGSGSTVRSALPV